MLDFRSALHFVALFLFTKGRGSHAGNILTFFLSKFATIVIICIFRWVLLALVCEDAGALQVNYILLHLQYLLSSSVTAPQHSGFVPYLMHGSHFIGARVKTVPYYAARLCFLTGRASAHGDEHPLLFSYSIFRNIPRFLFGSWNLLHGRLTQHGGSLSSSLNATCDRISNTSLL